MRLRGDACDFVRLTRRGAAAVAWRRDCPGRLKVVWIQCCSRPAGRRVAPDPLRRPYRLQKQPQGSQHLGSKQDHRWRIGPDRWEDDDMDQVPFPHICRWIGVLCRAPVHVSEFDTRDGLTSAVGRACGGEQQRGGKRTSMSFLQVATDWIAPCGWRPLKFQMYQRRQDRM